MISNCAIFSPDRPESPLGPNDLRLGMEIITPMLGLATVKVDTYGSPYAENDHSLIFLDFDDDLQQWISIGGANKRGLMKLEVQYTGDGIIEDLTEKLPSPTSPVETGEAPPTE